MLHFGDLQFDDGMWGNFECILGNMISGAILGIQTFFV